MSYVHDRQSFFVYFGRQVSVKSSIAKMIKKFRKTGSLLDKNRVVLRRAFHFVEGTTQNNKTVITHNSTQPTQIGLLY
jgi:Pyruvate/2-oxoacid:ferredoxin oxidoreductase gamma subunit